MCYSSFLMDSCGIEKTFLPALGNYSLLYSFFSFLFCSLCGEFEMVLFKPNVLNHPHNAVDDYWCLRKSFEQITEKRKYCLMLHSVHRALFVF